jgi:hypothetical protein
LRAIRKLGKSGVNKNRAKSNQEKVKLRINKKDPLETSPKVRFQREKVFGKFLNFL